MVSSPYFIVDFGLRFLEGVFRSMFQEEKVILFFQGEGILRGRFRVNVEFQLVNGNGQIYSSRYLTFISKGCFWGP